MQQFTTDLLMMHGVGPLSTMPMSEALPSVNAPSLAAFTGIQLLALTDDNTLVWFKANNPSDTTAIPVTGINGTLLGIDTRPANGLIYGLTTANELYTLDPLGFAKGDFGGDFTLTDEEQSLLESGNLYINLHTQTFNGGELRGQIDVTPENDIVTRGLILSEDQQVGAVVPDGPATGTFDVIYDDATNALTITGSFSDLTSDLLPVGDIDAEGNFQSAVHLHSGAAGANGPIVRNFTVEPSGNFTGSFILTDAEEALFLDSALYVNVHTANANGGELRGQVTVNLENDIVASGIPIEEGQEVGDGAPADGPATGGFDLVYDNSTNNLSLTGSFSDLSSPLLPVGPAADVEGNPQSAIHLHQGAAGENGPIVRTLTTSDQVATLVSTLSQPFDGGVVSGFDFNPVADRLRLVGDNDQNFRINVDTGVVIADGTLAFADGDVNAGVNPNVTASAYTNSFAGTTTTQLYNIDTLLNSLLLQSPPNAGTLQTISDLGVNIGIGGGFDILSSEAGDNTAFVVSNSTLYALDLGSGVASVSPIGDMSDLNFIGLAALPSPVEPLEALDFEMVAGMALAAGTVITDQFADWGITVSTDTEFGAMLFDTANPTGGDGDLAAIGLGNVLIISEDGDSSDPDDNVHGGTISFDFDELIGIATVGFLDIEERGSTVTFFDEMNQAFATLEIPPMGNSSLQDLGVNLDGISRMDVFLSGSGALTEITFLTPESSGAIAA